MSNKRVALIGSFLESNRYSSVVNRERFHVTRGDSIVDDARSESPKLLKEGQGFFAAMDAFGAWQPVPVAMIIGGAGGSAEHKFIQEETANIYSSLLASSPVDAVYILNHGAMITTDDEDPDGTLYETVRRAVGAQTPIVATVDLHANISQKMVDNADIIVSYITDPHIDQFERGQEAAELVQQMLDGLQPKVSNIRVPIVAPNVSLLTDHGPYGDLIDFGQSKLSHEILNVSVVAGFAYSDTSTNGLHIIVTARNNQEAADQLCFTLAKKAWSMRQRFLWHLVPIESAIKRAVNVGHDAKKAPILLADLGDNVGAGGPGNTLWLLEALIKAKAKNVVIGSFFDPLLVEKATTTGIGKPFQATFKGDTWDRENPQLVVDRVTVHQLHSGKFYIKSGPLKGMLVNAGPVCLLQVEDISVLVTSRRPIVWPDPSYLEALGIEMSTIRTLVLKCRSNYRAVFDKYFGAENMIEVDTPGRTSPVLTRHDFKFIPRPSYPLDTDFEWHPELNLD
ncbi:M81 family metallopeptidase [Pseudomonadales bacterium]|jgi:microcystin degradation protein MlrC|nr:M81 family metallopeptidase [Gammaproteobacteria bacterium]MDA7726503.1 M81 family metallopeptidase [Pseudomonadales bacterium]MBT3708303.1 M81 family metallopeptidase [Gammaproteobacteria bacterium]MBT3735499.1 M81 family metallopeptidase [Gammaproteobacteria bacterium]MBT3897646.1 M81 family metallopeptidase [Gammaproteobacteria bacterium]|tara:strand:- start:1461 stop:2987 length:1527 start_codon:yes stop_codon:yes gene_type:complete